MKSRWTLLVLMVWAVVAPTLAIVGWHPIANAGRGTVPPSSCSWVNTTTISCSWTTPTSLTLTFTPDTRNVSNPQRSYNAGVVGDIDNGVYHSIENVSGDGTSGQYTVDGTSIGTITIGNQAASGRLANAPDAPADGSEDPDTAVKCDAGKGFTWLICGTIEWALGVIDWIRNTVLIPMLKQAPLDKDAVEIAPLYAVWAGMRNIASIVLILMFLLIIFGTAIGYDNYTIKKTLPRLVVGAILTPLSWYICVLLVDVGNILGVGLKDLTAPLIPQPTIDFTSPISEAIYGVGGGILLGVTGFTAYTGMLWPVLLGMVVGLAATFLTLTLRNILILVLVAISPLAMLAYILPNTKKFYDMWQSNFLRLILMFPFIVLLFQAGRLFAAVAGGSGNVAFADPIRAIFALIGLTLPLFLIPWTFKTAGKALSFGQNYIDKAKGVANKQMTNRLGNSIKSGYENRKAMRQHNATLRAKDIDRETPTTLGGKISKNARQRIAMKSAGHGGFMGGKGNALQRLKFEDAASAAYGTQGKIEAAADAGATGTGETNKERIAAEKALALKGITEGRANRKGLMQAVGEAEGANINEKTINFAKAAYSAGTESSRKSNAKLLGTGTGVQAAAAAGGLASTGAVVADARKTQIDSLSDEKGQTEGRLTGQRHLENVELENMGITNPNLATDAQRATARARIQSYRQTDARVQARDSVLDQGGKTMQSQTDFDTHGYTNAGTVVGSAILQQRGNLSATRQARLQRVAIQGTAEGHMTDREVEQAASREAQESIGAQVMAQKRGNQVDFESNLKAAVTGDATQAASLDNRLIAAGKKSRDTAVASSSQRTAAVRSVQGYNGQLPTQRSISEQLDDAAYKATTEQAAADMAIGERLQELDEAEDRMLLENAGVNPKTATAAQRAAIIGGASGAQRAAARAQISSQVATQSAGEAGYNLRTQIAKARGEIKGFDEAIDEVQLEETTNRFREADIQRRMSSKGLTRAEAEAESFKTITADRMKDLAARGIGSGTGVSRDEAIRLYHDASAENTYLAAAQAQAGSVGQAIGKDQIADTAMGVAAGDILQKQAEQATGLKDDVAMEAFLNAQILAKGGTPSSVTRENLRDTLISSLANQAQSAVIGSAALAGMDAGQRTEANTQGTLLAQQEAYNSPTKASASQQLDMARRDATDTLAAKEGVQAARQNQPQKDYGKTVADARKAQNAKVMQDAIRDAGQETIKDENSGIMVRIADAKPGGKMTEEVEKQAEQAYIDGNHARFAALVSILSKTSSGSDAARKLLDRTFKRNGSSTDRKKEADRLEKQAKDKGNQDFTYEDFYQTVTAPFNADKRPDIAKGEKAAFEDAKASEVAVMDYRTKGRLFEYSLRPVSVPPTDPEYGKQTGARKVQISQTAANLKQIMTDRNLTSKQTTADFAQMYSFLFDGTTDSKGNVTGLGTPRREAMDAFKAQFGGETPQYKEVMAKITRDFKSQNNLP